MSPGTGTGSAPNSSPCVGVCLTGPDHDLLTLPKKEERKTIIHYAHFYSNYKKGNYYRRKYLILYDMDKLTPLMT